MRLELLQLNAAAHGRFEQQPSDARCRRFDQQAMNLALRQQTDEPFGFCTVGGDERHKAAGVAIERLDPADQPLAEHGRVDERDAATARLDRGF